MNRSPKIFTAPLAAVLAVAAGAPFAQTYPNRPIKLIVGYPPGGSNDILGRLVAPRLGERLGQSVFVENKPGADSIIGTEYVSKATPDGYTLLVSSAAMILNASLYDRVPYDTEKDFIPITLFASDPLVFSVHPSVPAKTIANASRNWPRALAQNKRRAAARSE
jgi:tripartite-type tricarboxylate transporter receptor subunit TctC